MIRVSDSQLLITLDNNPTCRYFLAAGSDVYLQYTVQTQLKTALQARGVAEHYLFTIDNQTDWSQILQRSQAMSLFSTQLLLILQFGETSLTVALAKKLDELCTHLSPEISLLISLPKITKSQQSSAWYKTLSELAIMVNCDTPDLQQLPQWIRQQLQQLSLSIEPSGIDLLCYYYEGNLLALAQTLSQLKLLYPTGKISYNQLAHNINDAALFTPYHWIDALIMGKTKRSMHILQQLKLNDIEPLILLRVMQRELTQLINLKKYTVSHNLKAAYDTYKVWQNRRNMLTPYLNRTSLLKLYQLLHKLTEIEIMLKHDYQSSIWQQLDMLNRLFIGSNL